MSEPTEKDRERARHLRSRVMGEYAKGLDGWADLIDRFAPAEFAAVREEAQAERGRLGDPELEARHEYRVEEFKRAEARIRELEAEVERLTRLSSNYRESVKDYDRDLKKAEADLAALREELKRRMSGDWHA